MIYQDRKKLKVKSEKLKVSQQGVTLFLGILVLSSLLAISFSLATILFIEVQTSSDLTKTEGALAGANGVAEQALYNIERGVQCDTQDQGQCYTAAFTNHVTLNGQPEKSTIASPSFVDKIAPSSYSLLNTLNKYDFCAINSPSNQGCGYGKVTVTYEPSGNTDPLVAYLCQFDASGNTTYNSPPCTDINEADYWLSGSCGTTVMTQTGCAQQTWDNFDPNMQQELILFDGYRISSNDMYVQIQTYDTDGITGKGLPYANKTAVSINAVNGAVGRKIKVVVPNPASSNSNASSGNIARVQSQHEYPTDGILPFSGNTQAGDLIVGTATWYQNAVQPTCTDTQGNIFTNIPIFSGAESTTFICYASNITGGADTITMSGIPLGGAPDPGMNIFEYSGIVPSNPLDFSSFLDYGSGNPAVTNPTSSSFTSNATDLIIPVFADEVVTQSAITAGNNFNMVQADGTHIDAEEEWLNAGQQTATASFNLTSASNHWSITVVGFKAQ